ncbi:MAG: hypothetical protein M3483_05555 [Gemmatimonadota bacterium]|nr:hypothetical protein [Gemmatimonadota bacterium]
MDSKIALLALNCLCASCGTAPSLNEDPSPAGEDPATHTIPAATPASWESLVFTAKLLPFSETTSKVLMTQITIENPTSRSVGFEIEGCPVRFLVYRSSVEADGPVWDENRVPAWNPISEVFTLCGERPTQHILAPGEQTLIEGRASVGQILGDSLTPGKYSFTVTLRMARPSEETPEIAAGEAELWYRAKR